MGTARVFHGSMGEQNEKRSHGIRGRLHVCNCNGGFGFGTAAHAVPRCHGYTVIQTHKDEGSSASGRLSGEERRKAETHVNSTVTDSCGVSAVCVSAIEEVTSLGDVLLLGVE